MLTSCLELRVQIKGIMHEASCDEPEQRWRRALAAAGPLQTPTRWSWFRLVQTEPGPGERGGPRTGGAGERAAPTAAAPPADSASLKPL